MKYEIPHPDNGLSMRLSKIIHKWNQGENPRVLYYFMIWDPELE